MTRLAKKQDLRDLTDKQIAEKVLDFWNQISDELPNNFDAFFDTMYDHVFDNTISDERFKKILEDCFPY